MTIKRITKINHRIFQNFSWPSDLPTFERYNLIYGWNGSGKTTLSNLFRALEKKTNITDGTVEFEFEGGNKLSGSNIYGNQTIPKIKVFNRELYGAFGYLKEKTVNAKQLFILTHHFTLFREAKNWIYYLKKKDHQKIAKYQIECERDANCRLSKICSLHKLLDEFDSEYYYLFDRVYSIGYHVASSATIDQYYGLPNIARRLVEAFFAFKRPALLKGESDKGLLEAIQSTQLDIAEKTKIYRFINTFSHLRRIGEQEHEMSILSETPMIMRSVLEMIKAEDPIHFAEMKQVIGVRV